MGTFWTPNTETDPRLASGLGGRFYGIYPAEVVEIADPDGQGRVRVRLPWTEAGYEAWARLATLMGGNNRGTWFIPDVGDEVVVCFEAGDPSRPYVVGALWNGQDTPPEQMDDAGENNIKAIRSRNGVRIRIDDSNGQESITIETPGGQKIVMQDGPGSIQMRDSNGNTITMDAGGITISASAKITLQASTIDISSSLISASVPFSDFSGVLKSSTLITNSVVSSSYTPGAGNIW
nr:phage baseplate assembly protein V [Ardenticatena sp.]